MPLALESAIVHWFCCVLTDDDTYQISSATQFSAQQEDSKKTKQIENEKVSKETELVEGII